MIQTLNPLSKLNPEAEEDEQYVLLHNVTWEMLEKIEEGLEGTKARLTFIDGILEIMAPPSEEHEEPKSTVSSLLEIYLRERNIRFYIRGSLKLGKKEDQARGEPDESYSLGSKKAIPDIVLEVVVTSGGINKLALYFRLKVPEVWFWQDGVISVYRLREAGYEKVTRSELLSDLDLEMLARYSRMADQYDAIAEFTQALRSQLS